MLINQNRVYFVNWIWFSFPRLQILLDRYHGIQTAALQQYMTYVLFTSSKFDIYSKADTFVDPGTLGPYYQLLIDKYTWKDSVVNNGQPFSSSSSSSVSHAMRSKHPESGWTRT